MKIQPTEWDKIFANHISDNNVASRKYKAGLQLNNKKTNNPIFLNGQKIWIDISPKKVYRGQTSTWKYAQHH